MSISRALAIVRSPRPRLREVDIGRHQRREVRLLAHPPGEPGPELRHHHLEHAGRRPPPGRPMVGHGPCLEEGPEFGRVVQALGVHREPGGGERPAGTRRRRTASRTRDGAPRRAGAEAPLPASRPRPPPGAGAASPPPRPRPGAAPLRSRASGAAARTSPTRARAAAAVRPRAGSGPVAAPACEPARRPGTRGDAGPRRSRRAGSIWGSSSWRRERRAGRRQGCRRPPGRG